MQLLTVKELSKLIKVKQSTLYAWASKGLIPCHKLNSLLRFEFEEIEEWINNSKTLPQEPPVLSKRESSQDIDSIIKKTIEDVKGKKYNQPNGKPGQNRGLRKEA